MTPEDPKDPQKPLDPKQALGIGRGNAGKEHTPPEPGRTDTPKGLEPVRPRPGMVNGLGLNGPGQTIGSMRRPSSPEAPDAAKPARDATKAPVVAQGQEGEKRAFRGFGKPKEPSQDKGKEKGPEQDSGRKQFRSFGKGDLSKEFDRSR